MEPVDGITLLVACDNSRPSSLPARVVVSLETPLGPGAKGKFTKKQTVKHTVFFNERYTVDGETPFRFTNVFETIEWLLWA